MTDRSDPLRPFLGKCIAGPADVFRPTGPGREALERSIAGLEAARALPELDDAERALCDAMLEGARHRLETGCFCKHAAANEFARQLQAGGAVSKLPARGE